MGPFFPIVVVVPAVILAVLVASPEADKLWMVPTFHFYIVSVASLMAAFISGVLVLSARSIRETRILFLALCFMALGAIFSIHGLMTPGHLYHEFYSVLAASPWVSTMAASVFAALSVVTIGSMENSRGRYLARAVFLCVSLALAAFVGISLAVPNWLDFLPTQNEAFQHTLTGLVVGLFIFAAWRYYQSYLLARLTSQLSIVLGLLVLAEAQLALDFGRVWHLSWWAYHGLFWVAFAVVLGGWIWEWSRAKSVKAIAEALVMRDALGQLSRGRHSSLLKLADEIESHDLATFRHVDRVAAYTFAIGYEMGLPPASLRRLTLGAQMHDIGKIGLPLYILKKPGKLTEAEFEQVKQHTVKGWEIAQQVKALRELGELIRHHHERFDGSGYPDGLKGEQIPLESRIISAADTFDAVTSERPYRPAMTLADAKEELLRVAGSQLDPRCVEALLKALDQGRFSAGAPSEQPTLATTPAGD